MDTILTWDFFKNILLLFTIVLFLGIIFWIVERRKSELFAKGPWGILDGSYFVTAVMGTFGFGDIVTKTKTGKIICIFLMWFSLGITGVFVANISSALTVAALDEDNFNLNDLTKMKVGTIEGTTSSKFLRSNDIKYVTYDNALEALDAINDGSLSAFVYDTPVLKYFLSRDKYEGLILAPTEFKKETYGFISGDDNLINKLNPLLLKKIQSNDWDATLSKYNLD
jgi:ABC-type amino acid transport substrate-binding protein